MTGPTSVAGCSIVSDINMRAILGGCQWPTLFICSWARVQHMQQKLGAWCTWAVRALLLLTATCVVRGAASPGRGGVQGRARSHLWESGAVVADGDVQRFKQGPYAPMPALPTGQGGSPLPLRTSGSPIAVLTISGRLRGPVLPMAPARGLQRSRRRVPAASASTSLQL